MAFEKIDDLPNEVKEKLPHGAQNIFKAAYNSASSDGMSDEGAKRVAWNSIRTNFAEGADGKWYAKPEGGAGNTPLGTMPGS